MLRVRVIPSLLLRGESLVKTVRFGRFAYIGDPTNTCRIFNELEVDELAILDISATREGRAPNYRVLADLANECFMPLSYGGGITSVDEADRLFSIGIEKVIVNTAALRHPDLITALARAFGSQSVIVAIDVKADIFGRPRCRYASATRNSGRTPEAWAKEAAERGAGEILLTSIDREGTWRGFDVDLVRSVASAVSVPVIAHGGGGSVAHIRDAVKQGGASAVALGSMVVYQKKGAGVLVNFPSEQELAAALA